MIQHRLTNTITVYMYIDMLQCTYLDMYPNRSETIILYKNVIFFIKPA